MILKHLITFDLQDCICIMYLISIYSNFVKLLSTIFTFKLSTLNQEYWHYTEASLEGGWGLVSWHKKVTKSFKRKLGFPRSMIPTNLLRWHLEDMFWFQKHKLMNPKNSVLKHPDIFKNKNWWESLYFWATKKPELVIHERT